MSMTDPIADMFTRIRNAQATAKPTVRMPASKTKQAIAKVLKDEGYVRDFQVTKQANNKAELEIAYRWYERRLKGLGDEFLNSLNQVVEIVSDYPEGFPVVHADVRRVILKRFPYSVLYRVSRIRS